MKKPKKSKLFTNKLERYGIGLFKYKKIVSKYIGQEHGIYALYNKNTLHYVGKASDLSRRLKYHNKDKNKKWDRFSVFFAKEKQYIDDIESVILHIVRPPGNRNKPQIKIEPAKQLKRLIKKDLKKAQRDERNNITGGENITRFKSNQQLDKYSINSYMPFKKNKNICRLFKSVRREILALHNDLKQEYQRCYIAYKINHHNMVCIIPRNNKLLLTLNLKFHQVIDPKGMARDVSNIGHGGTGKVEVALTPQSDMKYVMGLVCQSLYKQIPFKKAS